MSPDKGQGTIPLDDMRSRSANGHAVLRKERKPPKSADLDKIQEAGEKEDEPSKEEKDAENDEVPEFLDIEHKEEPEDQIIPDFNHEEPSESIDPDILPARRYNLNMTLPLLDADHSDDDFDLLGRMPGSIYASADSFSSMESESFTPRRRPSDAAMRDEIRSQHHLKRLQDTVAKLTAEKEAAEREAERAVGQVEELKHLLNADMEEIAKDAESLGNEIKKFKEENRHLKEELNDAQSHIFSLQPYRKDLTSEEVGRQYDDLVEQVRDWVQEFMEPWLDDWETGIEALATAVRKQAGEAARFRRTVQKYPDLVHGSLFPETDEDIIIAIVMRYINDNIFQKILYGSVSSYTEMISFIETQMQASVEPKRDLFAVRTWTAESYNALISAPPFKNVRIRRSKDMTMELANILQIFCKKDRFQWFCQNTEERCIRPAMALYEKLQVSTHHFYLDVQPYISWGTGSRLSLAAEFLDHIDELSCKNLLQNRKAFNLDKMEPRPTKSDLHQKLMNVCTVVPALYMRQIGQRDAIKAPSIVRKQQMLVAWGSTEKRESFKEENDQSLTSHLYFAKSRKAGGGWWA